MTILVIGANGATGRLLVRQLLDDGKSVKIIVRSVESLPDTVLNNDNLSVIKESILDVEGAKLVQYVKNCTAVAFCLGHNLSFKGIFGQPRKLVTDAVKNICKAIKSNNPQNPVKLVLMNTAGNSNRGLSEQITFGQKCVIWLLRLLLPPHVDNEQAAEYLRTEIGQNNSAIEWVAVRPDDLVNENIVTDYNIYPSPIRSAIFDAGKTSRVNVGHFMAKLIADAEAWEQWKGKMPVIYNESEV